MLYYERAVALNRDRHHKLRIQPLQRPYEFATATNAMLIATTELPEASRDYPVVFVGPEGGPFSLAALVGLKNDQNLMVDAEGNWDPTAYVPAFARRYPFVLAEGDDKAVLTVCLDESCAAFNEERGEALFDSDGRETEYLQRVLAFLRAFHDDMQATRAFTDRVGALGLLVSKVITVEQQHDGQPQRYTLDGLWIVDEEKLRGIDDARAAELFRNGYLGWIYAHLLSLRNVRRLASRLDQTTRVTEGGGLDAAPL